METFLRSQFEPLQYVAFFGALIVLGLAETLLPLRPWREGRAERWPANFGLTLLNIAVISLVPVSGLALADWARTAEFGLLNLLGAGSVLAIIAGVIARSLTNYGVHFAMHKVRLLWRLHRVHHSDAELDVSTAVRFHPLEFAIQMPISLVAIAALGVPPLAIIIYELLDAFMAAWTHANVRLPQSVERILGFVIITPGMHRIHHSSEWRETDSNYGATFSFWDRLFGTYRDQPLAASAAMQLGLKECQDERSRSFLWLLKLPFVRLLALAPKDRLS